MISNSISPLLQKGLTLLIHHSASDPFLTSLLLLYLIVFWEASLIVQHLLLLGICFRLSNGSKPKTLTILQHFTSPRFGAALVEL